MSSDAKETVYRRSTSNTANASGASSSSATTVSGGKRHLNEWLRSIVMSRAVFILCRGFNPDAASADEDFFIDVMGGKAPNFVEDDAKTIVALRDNLLDCVLSNLNNHETALRKAMAMTLDRMLSGKELRVAPEKRVVHDDGNPRDRIDILFGGEGRVLGVVEVGFSRSVSNVDVVFWNKVNQGLNYLNLLGEKGAKIEDENFIVDKKKTVLLCVLVMTKDRQRGRIAVFACERKHDGTWRVALMYRKEAETQALLTAFGHYVHSIGYVLKKSSWLYQASPEWKYLGPNCSKVLVGENFFVLRSYDNRVRQTSRSPYVYKEWEKIKQDTRSIVWREDRQDEAEDIEFRDSEYYEQSTLFRTDKKCGKLEVIAVPFVDGVHYCSTVADVLHATRCLQDMHKDGFVHGDIRALNIVFAGEKTALIDFDFGGRVDKVAFPPGYSCFLPDGSRGGAEADVKITKELDRSALQQVALKHGPETSKLDDKELTQFYRNWHKNFGEATSLEEMNEALTDMTATWKLEVSDEQFNSLLTKMAKKDDPSKVITQEGQAVTPEKRVSLKGALSTPANRQAEERAKKHKVG